MKTCPMCHGTVEDGSRYCPFCGASVTGDTFGQEAAETKSAPTETADNPFLQPIPPANPFAQTAPSAPPAETVDATKVKHQQKLDVLTKIARSKIFLTACILFTLSAVATLITNLINTNILGGLITAGFSAIGIVAMWLCFSAARKNTALDSGVRLGYTATMIQVVLSSILIGLVVLVALLILAMSGTVVDMIGQATGEYGSVDAVAATAAVAAVRIMGIILLVVGLIVIIPLAFYLHNMRKYASSLRNTVSNGAPLLHARGLSMFMFVFAGLSLLGSFLGLFQFNEMNDVMNSLDFNIVAQTTVELVFGFIFSAVNSVAMILLGVSIRRSNAVNSVAEVQ